MFRSAAQGGRSLVARGSDPPDRPGSPATPLGGQDPCDGAGVRDAPQQVNFLLVLVQAGQSNLRWAPAPAATMTLSPMRRAILCGQRDRVAAAVVRRGPDRDQAALLQAAPASPSPAPC